MAATSAERELEEQLAELRPTTRYQDLAIWFRRLTVESAAEIPDDTTLVADDGTLFRCRRNEQVIAVASDPAGSSTHLEDGATLRWSGGAAILRVEVLARFGGRWDHRENRFTTAPPKKPLLLDVQEAQVDFARWFVERWKAFKARRRDIKVVAVLVDARGGGKTWIVLFLLFAAMIDFPKHPDGSEFVLWFVSVNNPMRAELDREIRRWLPADWYRIREWPLHQLLTINGGRIELLSADDPEHLRRGRVDVVWANEGALMPSAVVETSMARTRDRLGFSVITTNPPTEDCPKGSWVADVNEEQLDAAKAGELNPYVYLRCKAQLNALQDREAADPYDKALRMINPDRAAADVDGILRSVGEYAYRPPFSHREHVIEADPATWARRDVTRQLTLQRCGREYDWILGADFQTHPAMVACAMKVYDSTEREKLTILVWSAFWVPGDEDDLIDAVAEDHEWLALDPKAQPRFSRANAVWIGDPSGTWQDGGHSETGFSGKDSFAVFRARDWRMLPPMPPRDPDKKPPHPPVALRVGRMNGLINEKRLLVARNKTTEPLVMSLKDCRTARSGFKTIPKPGSNETHLPDALGYAVWWIVPRYQANSESRQRAKSLGAGWRRSGRRR